MARLHAILLLLLGLLASQSVAPIVVSPDDAAHQLGICRATVYKLMASGELPSHKVGRSRRIRVADIEAYLDRHRIDEGVAS